MMSLSDLMPLRTTASWANAQAIEYLPHVYGKCTLTPIQYSENRKEWFIADHTIGKIVAVYRDGSLEQGFILRNEQDSTGHAVAIMELAKPLASSSTLLVQVLGKLSATTGQVIEHPADVFLDVLSITGHTVNASRLARFREEYTGWAIAGCLTGGITVRAQLQEIMSSVGAAWALTMPCLAMAFPRAIATGAESITRFEHTVISDVELSTAQDAIASTLRVDYAKEWGNSNKLKSLTLNTVNWLSEIDATKVFPAYWLTDARTAFAVGSRLLGYMAIPVWKCAFTVDLQTTPVLPGDWVAVEYFPLQWQTAVASNVETDWAKGVQRIYCEFPSQDYPDVEITQQTDAFKESKNALRVTYANGIATIIILDDAENPIPNAIVTLDGNSVKTNKQGEAKFKTNRGLHSIIIEAAGYSKLTTEVTI